ncbi:hypothetical protein B0H10DRAFT_1952334 [Mycena sp. CBHHK59/15]|nr:hypothetical protein B0H10DRAFT_1952334 [Mycena sp. CBHHK59/15]
MDIHTVRGLLYFQNLTQIDILTMVGLDLDDSAVDEIARAWPQVETLYLMGCSHYTELCPTLQRLCSFTQHCASLRTLWIAFDASIVPTPRIVVSQQALTELDVWNSPITTPLPVARFIAANFLNLEYIGSCWNGWDEFDDDDMFLHDSWDEVDRLVQGDDLSEGERDWERNGS